MKKLLMILVLGLSLLFVSCSILDSSKVIEYKVSFASNGGSIVSDIIVEKGKTIEEPNEPTKEGYIFDGWYKDYDLIYKFDFETVITKNMTLYAKWIPNELYYNVAFVTYDGTYIAPIKVKAGDKLNVEDPVRKGYQFVGWYADEALTIKFDKDSLIYQDLVLYAKYDNSETPKKVTIYFVTNCDEKLDYIICYTGEKLKEPELKSRENYRFIGWYKDSNFENKFDFRSKVETAMTLYAKWEVITYQITFDTNGGTTLEPQVVSAIEKPSYPEEPTRDGYEFVGWYVDEKLTIKYYFDEYLTEDINIYAKWKEIEPLSNDATLSNIYINGNPLEDFVSNLYIYYVNDTSSNNKFAVSGTPNDVKATVTGNGTYDILPGTSKTISLVVKAEDNTKLTYKVTITALESSVVEKEFIYCSGLYESIAATFIDNNYENVKVYYKKSISSTYEEVDKKLVRLENGVVRVDILGLTKGTYDIKVILSDTSIITKNSIEVDEYDRSGYAFFDTSTNSIGAYNEDGSLKSNADVIYVTNETKNTITYNGKTGLVAILESLKSVSKPVCIRIIGSITTNQFKSKSDAPRLADGSNYNSNTLVDFYTNELDDEYGENLVGLTSKVVIQGQKEITHISTKTSSTVTMKSRTSSSTTTYSRTTYSSITGKMVFDDDSSYNMTTVTTTSGLTLEGVGTNAEIFQWGINFKKSCNVEVRNITFTNAPEDACSFTGGSSTDNNYYGIWVHNNTFNKGLNNWDITGERDKYNGDGAIDLTYVHGVTLSYNKFNNTHKTGLVGGSDSNMQYNITFHHNYYNNVSSRLPLGRQANMHIYNNYYYNCGSTLDIRANGYVLSECNYFENSRVPKVEVRNDIISAVKSYNDVFINCSGTQQVTIVTSRTAKVTNTNTYGTSFDTDSNKFYYNSTTKKSDVKLLTDANKAKEDCINYAGVLKPNQ